MSDVSSDDIPDMNKWQLVIVAEAEVIPGSPEEKARCEAIYQASLKEKTS